MKKSILSLFILALIVAGLSCKKNDEGGKARISGKVMHHDKPIPFARVFIKYGAKEFPGSDSTQYNKTIVTGADASYSFDCYKGDYFLYGKGYDTDIQEEVTGGIHVKTRSKQKQTIDVPVTE